MPYCAYCGTEVGTDVAACPKCGHPQGAPLVPGAPAGTDGQAILSLVTGLIGVFVCPILVPSIVAIVSGNRVRRRISEGQAIEGGSLAKAGVILGWVGVGVFVLTVGVGIAALVVYLRTDGGMVEPDITF